MKVGSAFSKSVCAGLVLILAMPVTGYAEKSDYASAINIAGRQRMLTQRITKSHLQIGLGANIEKSKQDLNDAIVLFESQLKHLQGIGSGAKTSDTLARINKQWVPFKKAALSEFNSKEIRRLHSADEALLALCEELVYLIEDEGNIDTGRLINMAGRQRMLSQRLAKFYMLMAAGESTPYTRAQIDRTINEFSGALHALRQAPENTPVINAKLQQAAEQWTWLESSLLLAKNEYYPEIVADASEKILTIMNKVTGLYSELK